MPRLIFDDGKSRKFWEGSVEGSHFVVRFGRLGTTGQERRKELASPEAAQRELAAKRAEKLREGYAMDGTGTGAPAPVSAASPPSSPSLVQAPSSSPAHPFRFYGHRPVEWAEGANAGHFYELRFLRAGTPTQLSAVAAAWAAALAGTPVVTVEWTFAGEWALVRCGEEIPPRGDTHFEQFFAGIERALLAVHALLPLAEVVMGNARGGGASPWDQWSSARQPWPSPYPAFDPDYTRFYGTLLAGYEEIHGDAALGRGEKNAAFDDALQAAYAKHSLAEAKQQAEKAKKAGKLRFEPIDAPLVEELMAPERAKYDRWKVRFEALGIPMASVRLETRAGRIVTMVEVAPRESRLAFADPDDRELRVPDGPTFKGRVEAKLSPDEARLLVIVSEENLVVTCPVAGGVSTQVFRATTKRGLKDAEWLDDARMVVSADKQLHLVTLGPAGATLVSSTAAKSPSRLHALHGGTLVFVTSYDARADVYAVEGDTLRKLGGAAGEYQSLYELDGEFYTCGSPWCRIAGLPGAPPARPHFAN